VVLDDRKRARQRLTAVLMRHGRIWRGASYWTAAHRSWIAGQRFGEPALALAIGHYRATLEVREAELTAIEAELAPWAAREPLAGPVARLGCYRGIAELGGLTLAAEVAAWRRFPAARAFMSYTGLVPAGYSSGERTRRGHITKAGSEPVRTALTEAAWAYRHAPAIGAGLRRRTAPPGDPGPVVDGAAVAARPVRAPGARQAERPRRRPWSRSPASWPGSCGPR
jgi:transposase